MRIPTLTLICAAFIGAGANLPSLAGEVVDGLAAVINNTPITCSEVRDAVQAQEFLLRRQYPAGGSEFDRALAKVREDALESLIDRELILSEFEKMGGVIKPQFVDEQIQREIRQRTAGDRAKFVEQLKESGITWKKFREITYKRIVVQAMRSQQTRDVRPPTPAERDAFLKKNAAEFREKSFVKLRTITIPKYLQDPTITPDDQRKLTEEIRQRIVKGADFASEASTYSQDSVSDAGGDRGWIDSQAPDVNRILTAAAFSMKTGQVSGLIEDGNAFYILKVDDKRPGKMKPRSEIENTLNERVLLEKRKASLDQWLGRIRRNGSIKIFEGACD